MNEQDIEYHLRQQPLAKPPNHFDERIRTLFSETASARPPRTVSLWLAAAACLICAVIGFGIHSRFAPREQSPTIVYILPPSEALAKFLSGDRTRAPDRFDLSHARITVITQPTAAPNQL